MNIADELEIRNLIARLSRLADSYVDEQDILDEYTVDCELHLLSEDRPPYCGYAEIAARMRETRSAKLSETGEITVRHLITSLEVQADRQDPEVAHAHSMVLIPMMMDGAPVIVSYGTYEDKLRRENGRWKIATRRATGFGLKLEDGQLK